MLIASGGVAHAQRIPLRGPLHAPIERRLLRSGRLFLAALPGLAVARVEGTRAVVAGRADLHPFDFLGLGAWGSCGLPCGGDDGEVGWAAAGQVTIVPAWGKLALAGEVVVKMDLSAFGGLGAAQRPGGARLVPTFGGGMNLYLGEAVAAALEVRAIWPTTLVSVGLVLALPTAARWERG
ncbi:MAG: hypothetical protein HYY06_17450 [Deltaproteobacteria bacterium]|nr:hypothetical protein [Deltaproteobacteria bacterium]